MFPGFHSDNAISLLYCVETVVIYYRFPVNVEIGAVFTVDIEFVNPTGRNFYVPFEHCSYIYRNSTCRKCTCSSGIVDIIDSCRTIFRQIRKIWHLCPCPGIHGAVCGYEPVCSGIGRI